MRKVVLIVTAAVATAAPAVALANSSSAQNSAEKQCSAERTRMGSTTFTNTFGTKKNAFGKCVSHRTQQNKSDEGQAQNNAAKQCQAERTSLGTTPFDQKYGSNQNGKNAFGKCVSSKAKSMSEAEENEQVNDEVSAAKQCKSMQSANSSAFKDKFGTGNSKSNAFGKCVSQTAHQLEQQPSSS